MPDRQDDPVAVFAERKGKCMPAREDILKGRTLRRLHVGPIDFALRPGECVSIGGKSGAGKSVLLRMVADLDPHEGDALLDGAACSDMPAPGRNVGSSATGVVTRPKASLPLQVQPGMILFRYAKAVPFEYGAGLIPLDLAPAID
jgi:ABC-type glutathione transport system ATPase component